MSKVDPIYIIGVIREKEKNFLQPDEYIRLQEHVGALRDTAYGQTLPTHISLADADKAIEHHLREELTWLTSYLDNDQVIAFMTARYDAINIVSALLQKKRESNTLALPSSLGSISQDALFAAIWNSDFTQLAKSPWQHMIETEIEQLSKPDWHASQLLDRMATHVPAILEKAAFTPLTRQLAAIALHRSQTDAALRLENKQSLTDVINELHAWNHHHISQTIANQVKTHVSATEYELAWDKEIMAAISPYRFHVSGYDPVIAYWVAKQIESQNVRLIIAGKLASLPKETIASFSRPYYQPTLT